MTLAPAMTIKLVRHGQSLANTREALPHVAGVVGIGLTELGKQQAKAVGDVIGSASRSDAVIYSSLHELAGFVTSEF